MLPIGFHRRGRRWGGSAWQRGTSWLLHWRGATRRAAARNVSAISHLLCERRWRGAANCGISPLLESPADLFKTDGVAGARFTTSGNATLAGVSPNHKWSQPAGCTFDRFGSIFGMWPRRRARLSPDGKPSAPAHSCLTKFHPRLHLTAFSSCGHCGFGRLNDSWSRRRPAAALDGVFGCEPV
jgi:hypothetical protein